MANSVTHYKMEVEIDPAAWRLRVAADLTLGNTELLDLYLGPGAVIDELVEPEAAETTRVYDPDIPRVAPVSYMWKSPQLRHAPKALVTTLLAGDRYACVLYNGGVSRPLSRGAKISTTKEFRVADLQPINSITSGFVELNQCQFYYQIAGHGHPLTLLHAGICDSRMWDDQWSIFAQQYQVVRFDMRGFGQSSAPSLPFAPHDDLCALLQFLGIRNTYLLGASMGGQVALDFTLAHPEMVDGLILVASALTDRRPSDVLMQQWSQIGAALAGGDVAAANEIELRMWVDGPHRSPAEVASLVRTRVRDMNAIKFDKRTPEAQARLLDPPAAQRLGDVGVRTLVVVGALDYPDMLDSAERLTAGIPSAQQMVMAGTAHLPSMEQPLAFNRAVQAFLEPIDHGA